MSTDILLVGMTTAGRSFADCLLSDIESILRYPDARARQHGSIRARFVPPTAHA
jgi:hypothetical protein